MTLHIPTGCMGSKLRTLFTLTIRSKATQVFAETSNDRKERKEEVVPSPVAAARAILPSSEAGQKRSKNSKS